MAQRQRGQRHRLDRDAIVDQPVPHLVRRGLQCVDANIHAGPAGQGPQFGVDRVAQSPVQAVQQPGRHLQAHIAGGQGVVDLAECRDPALFGPVGRWWRIGAIAEHGGIEAAVG